jgi:serine/threonine-protein kinase ULK2
MPGPAAPASSRTGSSGSRKAADRQEQQAEGEELRPYVIVSNIGKGSFATVYKGYHEVRIANVV